jgi:hypothetical protein
VNEIALRIPFHLFPGHQFGKNAQHKSNAAENAVVGSLVGKNAQHEKNAAEQKRNQPYVLSYTSDIWLKFLVKDQTVIFVHSLC